MASLILRAFGGMAPSANAKALDPASAVYAQNLNQRFSDFRPLPGALVVGTATAGATLYRFETSGGFITRAGQVNFVRGPIPTDATERTYYTGDGLPSVTDTSGVVRQLGVPAPATAPTVAVNVTDEYSEDDVAAAQAKALADLTTVIWDNCERPYVGVTDTAIAFDHEPSSVPSVYRFVSRGTFVAGQFVPSNPSHKNLVDDRLGFNVKEYPGITGFAGFTPITIRGAEVKLKTALTTALQAVGDPSDQAGVRKLMTASQAATVVTNLTNDLKAADIARDAALPKIRALHEEFVTVANTGTAVSDSMRAARAAFYLRADVAAAIDAAIQSAASAIQSSLRTFGSPIDNPYVTNPM